MSHISAAWITSSVITFVFVILYPLVLALMARRWLGTGWKYFGYGALIFFLFQLVSRVPLVQIIQALLAPRLAASPLLLYGWLAVLVVTAALFEEIGRYLGYRWLMRREEKTWRKAVMYGLGHGGLESMVLVGGLALLSLIGLIVAASTNIQQLSAAQQTLVEQQLAAVAAQPVWLPLAGSWERLWTLPIQVAWSVLVLQVFRRKRNSWLWLAILTHMIVDGAVVFETQWPGLSQVSHILITELTVTIFGIVALWVIWILRDQPTETRAPEEQTPLPSHHAAPSPGA